MTKFRNIVKQLKKEHDRLTRQIQGVTAALSAFGAAYGSRAARKPKAVPQTEVGEAASKGKKSANAKRSGKKSAGPGKPRRTMSAAARKKIAAAQRLRWAKIKGK
jgi:hypothetical protein